METFTGDESGGGRKPLRKASLVKNSLRGLCIGVFIFGAIVFLQAHKSANALRSGSQSVDISDAEPAQPFIVKYVDSSTNLDGTVTVNATSTRYVKADGEWRIVLRRNTGKTAPSEDSKEATVYAGTPDGVFQKNNNSQSRRYVSPSDDDRNIFRYYRSANYLRNHREFFRTDVVAGLEVYVFRIEVADVAHPGSWMEISYSPRTGITPLRTVRHSSDGSETRQEAMVVEFKDVPEDLNNDLRGLPITPKEKQIQ